ITDRTAVSVTLNGAAIGVTRIDALTSTFLGLQPLVDDGLATLTLVATDAAGNVTVAKHTITKDATPPVITVQDPAVGVSTTATTLQVDGSVSDLTVISLTINGQAVVIAQDGGFATSIPL